MNPRRLVFTALVAVMCSLIVTGSVALADDPNPRPTSPVHIAPINGGTKTTGVEPPVAYHGGQVERTVKAYTIYWDPNDQISSGYKTLVNRYFRDIGGSDFYNVATQYYQKNPQSRFNLGKLFIRNRSTLGGTWTDHTPYPRAGTGDDPLNQFDIIFAVARAIQQKGWQPGLDTMFFVYTAPGIESCVLQISCTPGGPNPAYCAYHSFFPMNGEQVVYANMPYAETWGTQCRGFSTSPNGDIAADSEISITSHEHFEAATNPLIFGGWYDSDFEEIADKCAYNYGTIAQDGSNLTLSGNPYIIQLEWSNAQSGCVAAEPGQ